MFARECVGGGLCLCEYDGFSSQSVWYTLEYWVMVLETREKSSLKMCACACVSECVCVCVWHNKSTLRHGLGTCLMNDTEMWRMNAINCLL